MLNESARFPIPESVGLPLRIPSDHCDEGEEEHHDQKDHFATAEPELGLAENTDRYNVEQTTVRTTG